MKKVLPLFVVIMLGLSLVLSACGGGGASTNLKVNMTEFMFDPTDFTVPAGQQITLTATNNGAVEHELVIFKLGTDPGDKFGPEDEENIYWEVEVKPGATVTETFTAPAEPGTYYVTCGIEGHHEAGMNGSLIVVTE